MADLNKSMKSQVEKLIDEAMSNFNPNDIDNTISILKEAWELLPDPKTDWSDSFLISKYITHVYFNSKDFDNALKWARTFNESDPGRDFGESEFILGKVLYIKE